MMIWCGYIPYTKEEKAKAILFNGVDPDAFVPAFNIDGTQYYKRIK